MRIDLACQKVKWQIECADSNGKVVVMQIDSLSLNNGGCNVKA